MWQCVAECCSVLQRVAVCCSVLQCVAVCGSTLQCVAVCCSVLQCVAVCGDASYWGEQYNNRSPTFQKKNPKKKSSLWSTMFYSLFDGKTNCRSPTSKKKQPVEHHILVFLTGEDEIIRACQGAHRSIFSFLNLLTC